MQTIDPILPRKPLRPGHGLPPAVVGQSLRKPQPRKSIDGMTIAAAPPLPTPHPEVVVRRPVSHPAMPTTLHKSVTVRPIKTGLALPVRHRLSKKQTIIAIGTAVILVGGALITHQPLGQPLIILYGVIAVMRHISSRTTYILSLGAFITTIISLIVIGQPNIISAALAEYAFLFLIIGTIALGVELYGDN